jgi:type II secretory pathway component GspD/PulD (secretin)
LRGKRSVQRRKRHQRKTCHCGIHPPLIASRALAVTLLLSLAPLRALAADVPGVISVTQISATRAAQVIRDLYPHANVRIDRSANAVIVVASERDLAVMRALLTQLDVKSPLAHVARAIPLRTVRPSTLIDELRVLYPSARAVAAPGGHTLIVDAAPADAQEIAALIAAIDTPPAAAAPPVRATDALRITQASPAGVARAVAQLVPAVRLAVAGSNVIFSGSTDDVERAKSLAARLDTPAAGVRYPIVYRARYYDATSLAALLSRSFPAATITVARDVNALTIDAASSEQRRIADALAQLDTGPSSLPVAEPGVASAPFAAGNGTFAVYTLRAALPGINGAASTSASDIAATVTQALAQSAPDLRITVAATSNQLVLSGSPLSLQLARSLIDQLDVAQKLVVLDTQVLEIDENVSKNLGLSFTNPLISTNYAEVAPPNDANGNPQRLLGLGPLSRTPLSLGITLNLAISQGHGRVLANPRITTISGRTATIRAGDTISIQTTAGGGAGTVATTQLQTFQTGVTLDITPIVNADNFISVTLHPTVNSNLGLLAGIPQISTRDTQTTVALREDETLIIGGLIQENATRTDTKIPVLGDLPLIGKVFRDGQVNTTRNELIITVTPHIIDPSRLRVSPSNAAPQALPTLPPMTVVPPERPTALAVPPMRTIATPPPTAASSPAPAAPSAGGTGYVYGAIPPSLVLGPAEMPKIFFVALTPSLPWVGKTISVAAVTSTNVQRLSLTYGGGFTTQLSQSTSGHWQATFAFPLAASAALGSDPSVTLIATRADLAASARVVVPLINP